MNIFQFYIFSISENWSLADTSSSVTKSHIGKPQGANFLGGEGKGGDEGERSGGSEERWR